LNGASDPWMDTGVQTGRAENPSATWMKLGNDKCSRLNSFPNALYLKISERKQSRSEPVPNEVKASMDHPQAQIPGQPDAFAYSGDFPATRSPRAAFDPQRTRSGSCAIGPPSTLAYCNSCKMRCFLICMSPRVLRFPEPPRAPTDSPRYWNTANWLKLNTFSELTLNCVTQALPRAKCAPPGVNCSQGTRHEPG
jgi:hypothetical protein